MNSNEYRLLPVALAPHIKDAIIASGHFMPESLWAAIIAAHDLVAPALCPCGFDSTSCKHYNIEGDCRHVAAPERSETLADESGLRDAVQEGLRGLLGCGRVWSAWGVGTMSEDDFYHADETDECIDQVMDAIRPFFEASRPAASSSAAPSDLSQLVSISDVLEALDKLGERFSPETLAQGDIAALATDALHALPRHAVALAAPAASPAVLTDADIKHIVESIHWSFVDYSYDAQIEFARAIERHITGQTGGEG